LSWDVAGTKHKPTRTERKTQKPATENLSSNPAGNHSRAEGLTSHGKRVLRRQSKGWHEALPNFQLLNGSLDFSRARNWGLGGTTFTIGDGDMTTTAQANYNGSGIVLKDTYSPVTYAINADGTLKINGSFTWTTGEIAVVNLLGGSVNSTGAVLAGLTDNANNFISFQSVSSSFTAAFGGQFADLTAVTDQFGISFRNDSGWVLWVWLTMVILPLRLLSPSPPASPSSPACSA